MRPYATRRSSPAFGCSPLEMNAGIATSDSPVPGARGDLLPSVVLSRYAPAALVVTLNCRMLALGLAGSVYFCPRDCVCAKNAAIFQKSVRVFPRRYQLTVSRWPAPLWQEMQSIGMPRNFSAECDARLSYVS